MSAVILMDPKFPINVGNARRACACYGVETLIVTGRRYGYRMALETRSPRPLRMKAFDTTKILQTDRPFDDFAGMTFVAVEVLENAESLPHFRHPPNAAYVFGPEDGSLARQTLMKCQRFVRIPTAHCLNLATTVATVLYDRAAKLMHETQTSPTELGELLERPSE